MKKRTFYFSFFFLLIMLSTVVLIGARKDTGKSNYTELLPRKKSLEYTGEWGNVKRTAVVLKEKIKKNPEDIKSLLALTALYIQEGRSTGNFDHYNKGALKCIDAVLAKEENNFEALTFKATVFLSDHRFTEGLAIAGKARDLFPLNAYVYGLIVDGNVELRNYDKALEAADKMISIRPDIRSYSRIAYLREIFGDLEGAAEAMKMAVDAGAPGDENTEWCRVELGKLNEKMGKSLEAKMHYTIASENRMNYPYALAGLARIAILDKDYTTALNLYSRADSIIPELSFKEGMIEVYKLSGDTEKAKEMSKKLEEKLKLIKAKKL